MDRFKQVLKERSGLTLKTATAMMKSRGRKYLSKRWKNGRWVYVYAKDGARRPAQSLGTYTSLSNLGGSTGGARHVRLADGSEKVLKRSTGEAHLREEYAANRVYRAVGIPVPKVALSKDAYGKLVQVADYVSGTLLRDLSSRDRDAALDDLKRGFVVDALLANWDVTGLDDDNIVWDGERAYRIDNGGALRYRSQGASKGRAFSGNVGEIKTMRDEDTLAGQAYGSDVTDAEIRKQVREVVRKRDAILAAIDDPTLRRTVEKRIADLEARFGDTKKSRFDDGSLIKSDLGQWYLHTGGKLVPFVWLGPLEKSNTQAKAYYSAEEVKARGMRWVTIRGSRVLLQGTSDGGYVVVGGAGGKLNHLKIDNVLSAEDYAKKRKEREQKRREATQALSKEDMQEAVRKRKELQEARKAARAAYVQQVSELLGVDEKGMKALISADDMKAIEDRTRAMVETRKAAKTMSQDALDDAVEEQLKQEVNKAAQAQVKNVERQALEALAADYDVSDPNQKSGIADLLDKDKALEILAARKMFKKKLRALGNQSVDIPTDLKVGAVFAGADPSDIEEIQKEVQQQIETQKNIELYDLLNAQSQSIKQHVDQGAISSLNGLIGDVYGTGATFTTDTVKELGIEAIARAVTMKLQADGKGEVVRKALDEYVSNERARVVEDALRDTRKRMANADDLRELARDTDDAEAILSMASANGHALKQITAAQRSLGTAVGSLRAAAHMLNALDEPPADIVQVDVGKDLSRARDRARNAGLKKGEYRIKKVQRGRSSRLVLEIPKDSLDNFFQNETARSEQQSRIDKIKGHQVNSGYKPSGIKESIKFDDAQEAGLQFFREKGRVLLDFEAGLGKTGVAYAAMMEAMANRGAKKILVITPSATRGDFHKQRETFLDKDKQGLVRQSTANTTKAERRKRHLEQDGIHIVSQDSLREDASILREAGYDMVVVDEIHEMTAGTGHSGRYQALQQLDAVPLKVAMSGTNIKNSKKELYRKIAFVDPEHSLGSMQDFERRYKGLNQGTGIFQDAANDAFRKEVGEWMYTQKNRLPVENKQSDVKVPLSAKQRKAYAASERKYRDERDRKVPGAAARRDSRNYAILQNGDSDDNAKIGRMAEIMRTQHPKEKAVIHVSRPGSPVLKAMRTAQKRLASEFGADSVATIHGETSPGELAKIKARFNDPGDPLRFIVGTKSLESGHNLQAGGTVTFHLDIPDSAAAFDQRNARVFRKGQNRDTASYTLTGSNPLDMRAEDLMDTKRKEMGALGNPREVSAMDDSGFVGLLHKYEQEAGIGT